MTNSDEKKAGLMDEMYVLGKRRTEVELSGKVKQLEDKYREMQELCGEVITTITVNVKRGDLPEQMKSWSDGWFKRYESIKNS